MSSACLGPPQEEPERPPPVSLSSRPCVFKRPPHLVHLVLVSLDQSPFADVPQTQTGWAALSAGQNFTQDDVELNRLWYEHAAAAHGFKGHDSFGFSLTDLDNKSPAQSFFISINVPQKGQRSHLSDHLTSYDLYVCYCRAYFAT